MERHNTDPSILCTDYEHNKMYIYLIIINDTFEQYVGQAKDVEKRISTHRYNDSTLVDHKIKKHNYSYMVLEETDTSNVNGREIFWIDLLNTYYDLGFGGLNLTHGGDNACFSVSEDARRRISVATTIRFSDPEERLKVSKRSKEYWTEEKRIEKSEEMFGENNHFYGKHHSDETRELISSLAKERYSIPENNPMYGKHHSKETKDKISESEKGEKHWNYGKHLKEETKLKISEAQIGEKNHMYGKVGENNPRFGTHHTDESKSIISKKAKERLALKENHPLYGKHHSDETKKKISEKNKGRPSPMRIKVRCVETNEVFDSMAQAGESVNTSGSKIGLAIKNRKKCKGFHWERV